MASEKKAVYERSAHPIIQAGRSKARPLYQTLGITMDEFDAREEIHDRIVARLKKTSKKFFPIWLATIGTSWAYTHYQNSWLLYLVTLLLLTLLFFVSIPNLGCIVTLNTKFYGGMYRAIRNTVPIVYLGVFTLIYALLALWLGWKFPIFAVNLSCICALIS